MSSSKQIIVSFKLIDKTIGSIPVKGLADFWVDPRGEGVGRKALRFIEAVADPLPVVGFASDDILGFYEACEWVIGPAVNGKRVVMSEPIDVDKIGDETW